MDLKREDLKGKIFVGLVEENVDPRRLGRIRVRVQGVFEEIPLEHIPWAYPYKDLAGKTFSVPGVGKIVNVSFPQGNWYEPEYIFSEHYNINLSNKLDGLSDDEYKNFVALLFDHRTQVYSDDSELRLDYLYNNIKLKKDEINIHLKDNDQELHLGHDYADQSAVLGDHWMEWFDELMNTLLQPTSLVGNMGAPILKPQIDQLCIKYQALRPTFLSKHVKIVDNGACMKTDKDRQDAPAVDDVVEIDNELILNSNSVSDDTKEKIKDERKKESAKVEAAKPNPADEIPEQIEEELDSPMSEAVEKDPRTETVTLSTTEAYSLEKSNNVDERKSNNLFEIPKEKDVTKPYDDYWTGVNTSINPHAEKPEYQPNYGSYVAKDGPIYTGGELSPGEVNINSKVVNGWNPNTAKYGDKKIKNGFLSSTDLVVVVGFFHRGTKRKVQLREDAAKSFLRLNSLYKEKYNKDMVINDSYRDYDSQVKIKAKYPKPGQASTPGRSNHGWGLALDINGTYDSFSSELYKWLKTNGKDLGWGQPTGWPKRKPEKESWHWEYNPDNDKYLDEPLKEPEKITESSGTTETLGDIVTLSNGGEITKGTLGPKIWAILKKPDGTVVEGDVSFSVEWEVIVDDMILGQYPSGNVTIVT